MNQARIHHYGYLILALILLVTISLGFLHNLSSVKAEPSPVIITSPTENQKVAQGNFQITGTAPGLKTISVFDGTTKIGTTASNLTGNWTINWDNQHSGQHQLKAYMLTGTRYDTDTFSQHSVKSSDANTGQVSQSYNAGFSVTEGIVYDKSLDTVFVINSGSGTITVLDGATQEVLKSIELESFNAFSSYQQLVSTVDQNHHKLYLIYSGLLYIVDTQSQSLEDSITLPEEFLENLTETNTVGINIRYDAEGNYLYFYGDTYDLPIETSVHVTRLNLQTNTYDTTWNQSRGIIADLVSVLPGINGNVYLETTSSISVYNNQSDTLSPLSFDFSLCPAGIYGSNSAMSVDFKTLFFFCDKTVEEQYDREIIVYDTETEQQIDSFAAYQGAQGGQLTDHYYIQNGWSDAMYVYDTNSKTMLPEITGINALGGSNGNEDVSRAQRATNDGKLYLLTDRQTDDVHSLYMVDLQSGQIISQHTYDNAIGGRLLKLSNTNKLLLLNELNTLYVLDASNGTSVPKHYGMGTAAQVYHSATTDRVFSISVGSAESSSSIAVGNTITGEYESSVYLENVLALNGHMSENGETLYVLGVSRFSSGALRIYAIDTLSLTVSNIYTSVTMVNPNFGTLQLATLVGNDEKLILSSCGTIYNLDLASDTTQTVSTGDTSCRAPLNYLSQIKSALNNTGSRLAVITDWNTIKIFDTTTMTLVNTINRPGEAYTDSLKDIAFNTAGDIIVGSLGLTPQIFKYSASTGDLLATTPLENSCDVSNNTTMVNLQSTFNDDFMIADIACVNLQSLGSPSGISSNSQVAMSLIETEKNLEIIHKQATTSPLLNVLYTSMISNSSKLAGSVSVSTTDLQVTTIPENVVITSPANNTSLLKGKHVIKGSALANATITIKVDGSPVGTTTSAELGVWQYEYDFSKIGSITIQATIEDDNLQSDIHTVTVTQPSVQPAPTTSTPPTTVAPPMLPAELPSINSSISPDLKPSTKRVPLQKSEKELIQRSAFNEVILGVKRFVKRLPRPIINSVPYALMLVLIMQAGYYLFQSQKQLQMENRLKEIYEKQDVLNEERRNFLEVTSHYLRTPLTYIKAGTEMLVKEQPGSQKSHELNESVAHLGLFIESLVEESNNTRELEKIKVPPKIKSALLSKYFLIPLIGLMVTMGLFYLIFGVIGGIRYSTATYLTQGLIVFLLAQLFYGAYKNNQRLKIEKTHTEDLIRAEEAFDHTRSKLIADAGAQLNSRTSQIETILTQVGDPNDSNQRIIVQGIERLRDLSKSFLLVSQLEASNLSKTKATINARDLVADIVKSFESDLKSKHLKTEVIGLENGAIFSSDQSLTRLALRSLVQNAIQVSDEGSTITIKCLHDGKRLAFQVIDQGEGIPKEKIDQLFEPFVKVGPVTTFNHEGIGLSLYLDRLIMHGLGGEIDITSHLNRGTTATISFNG